jgi:hypothetical protein
MHRPYVFLNLKFSIASYPLQQIQLDDGNVHDSMNQRMRWVNCPVVGIAAQESCSSILKRVRE